jgi:hypothetical protein
MTDYTRVGRGCVLGIGDNCDVRSATVAVWVGESV